MWITPLLIFSGKKRGEFVATAASSPSKTVPQNQTHKPSRFRSQRMVRKGSKSCLVSAICSLVQKVRGGGGLGASMRVIMEGEKEEGGPSLSSIFVALPEGRKGDRRRGG